MRESASPTAADMLGEITTLLCFVAFFGPPVLFLVVPWLLFALLLMGPFAAMLTVVAVPVAAAVIVSGVAALLTAPLVMVRHRRAAHAPALRPAVSPVRVSHNPS